VQIKAGQSYIKNGRFYIGADRDHFETWARYAIPVAGIVLDPSSFQAGQPDIQRVHVTVASSRVDLIGYLRSFGFRVKGFSARRYPRRAAELVMAKQFLRLAVRTPHELGMLVDQLQSDIWGLDTNGTSRFGVSPDDLAVPMSVPAVTMTLNSSTSTVSPRLLLNSVTGEVVLQYDDETLMREFYPLRLHLPNKRYVVVPRYPNWVAAMLSSSGPHTAQITR
jgi:hypothetical protein